MVGIGDRDLVGCTRTGSPSGHPAAGTGAAADMIAPVLAEVAVTSTRRLLQRRDHPASGRVPPATAAGVCRPGTPPVRPDTVRAGSRTCRI